MLEYEGVLMVLCAHYAGPDNIRQESPKSLNPKTLNPKTLRDKFWGVQALRVNALGLKA